MLIKVYQATPDGERKYSPAEAKSVEVVPVGGRPDPERICTSIIERLSLSLRNGLSGMRFLLSHRLFRQGAELRGYGGHSQ